MNPAFEPAPARLSKLAVAALVIGLIPIIGLFGLLLGVIAVIRITRSNGSMRGIGFAIGGIVASFVIMVVTGFAGALFLPVLAKARAAAKMASSSNNMKALASTCHLYADENNQLPADLSQLYPALVNDYHVFKNPRFPNEAVGYIYVAGLAPKDNGGVLIYEAVPALNPPKEINICFVDITVKKIQTSDLAEYLAKTKALCEANGKEYKEVPVDYTVLASKK